jgi:flagellar hook assembly protein FlgD
MTKRTGIVCALAIAALVPALYGQSIHGIVSDAITKKPIREATITVIEMKRVITADSAGKYFSGNMDAGTYLVKIEAAGYLKLMKKIILTSKQGTAGTSDMELNAALYSIKSNADSSSGSLSINYYFPGHNTVDITIKGKNGKTVRSAYDRSRTGGTRTFKWDGKNNDGNLVEPGTYTCKIVSGRLVSVQTIEWKGK